VLGHVQHGVQAEQVDQVVGADGVDAGGADALVDRLDRQALLLLLAPDLGDPGVEDPVDDEARGPRAQVIGCLRIAWANVTVAPTVSAEVSSPSTISISGMTEAG
jgi:hypothetical protein